MWFDRVNAQPAIPVVFSARDRAVGETSVLNAWIRSRAHLRTPEALDSTATEAPEESAPPSEEPKRPRQSVYPSAAPKIEPDEVAESIVRVQEEILQNLSRAIRDVHVLGSSLRSELEEQLVLLAAKMAQRVIRRELSVDPSILAQLAREGIQALGDRQDVVIRIGRLPDRAQTDSLVQRIRDEYPETRIFIDDHRAPGACVVEAQMGRVDESLETRLDNVLQDVLGAHIDVVGSEI